MKRAGLLICIYTAEDGKIQVLTAARVEIEVKLILDFSLSFEPILLGCNEPRSSETKLLIPLLLNPLARFLRVPAVALLPLSSSNRPSRHHLPGVSSLIPSDPDPTLHPSPPPYPLRCCAGPALRLRRRGSVIGTGVCLRVGA